MIYIKTLVKKIILLIKRISRTFIDFVIILILSIKNLIIEKKLYDDKIVFVTAIDERFVGHCERLLVSFKKNLYKNQLIIYDLGCNSDSLENLKKINKNLIIKQYTHELIPGKFKNDSLSSYNWKPVIINEVLNEYKSKVVWIDSGNTINKKIILLKIALTANKLLVVKSSNLVHELSHKNTLSALSIPKDILKRNNFAGGLVGIDYKSEQYRKFIFEWMKNSQIKEIITPTGSNENNHRYDQTILTLLLHKNIFKNKIYKLTQPLLNFSVGVLFHNKRIIDL